MERDAVSQAVIGAAIAVHRELGPGLLESVYSACLCHEMARRRVPWQRQVKIPVRYAGEVMNAHFRVDLLVAGELIVELKCVESVLAIHRSQLITYLKLTNLRRGLLINFNVIRLTEGIVRVVV